MPKCPPTGGVRLQEVSISGGSTVLQLCAWFLGLGNMQSMSHLIEVLNVDYEHTSFPALSVQLANNKKT